MEEEEEELKAILREAFGESSSDEDSPHDRRRRDRTNDSIEKVAIFGDIQIWEPIVEINGLWICRDFLSADQQSSLLSSLGKEGYFAEGSHNQAMRFGDLPPWALELSYIIRENVLLHDFSSESVGLTTNDHRKDSCLFPSELLSREPLFDQFIVNIYQPGEGICAHVDLLRFEDGIAIISLESSCVMHFSSVVGEGNHLEEVDKECVPPAKIPVLLTPGSLVLMWGDARYLWKHEINRKPGVSNLGRPRNRAEEENVFNPQKAMSDRIKPVMLKHFKHTIVLQRSMSFFEEKCNMSDEDVHIKFDLTL